MSAINAHLVRNSLRLIDNPCISPDFCLDWPSLRSRLQQGGSGLSEHAPARLHVGTMTIRLHEDLLTGDHAWVVAGAQPGFLDDGADLPDGTRAYPASWTNLLRLKNHLQTADPTSTVFPSTAGRLPQCSLGVGSRFTTLHWPAVDWAMANLGLSMNANQNSIPRELVYEVQAMLENRLDSVPFPFIGADVPEGHQGQSVQGMSHGAVLARLKDGFHRRRLPWGFNADHQPIGGRFDAREPALVDGSLLATSITFDLSPELAATVVGDTAAVDQAVAAIDPTLIAQVRSRMAAVGVSMEETAFRRLLAQVWPAMLKMQRRDRLYREARERAFSTPIGRDFVRELSIDELPGLTEPATLAAMLALAEALGMRIHFVAPAFGFQKNFPFADQAALEFRVGAAWRIAQAFEVGLGFHSGSGKSAENYQLCGRITGGRLEIKTSGRYTYEMGRALAASADPTDQTLWRDWYAFTRDLAIAGAFSLNPTEQKAARSFISHALQQAGRSTEVFATPTACRVAIEALPPSPDHMFHFEYNFLFVLAAGGQAHKGNLGDHSPAGYQQRARFYRISPAARLAYARNVAEYLIFLAETTGLTPAATCATARARLGTYRSYQELVADIAG